MSELSKLVDTGKDYQLGPIKIKLMPLSLDELDKLDVGSEDESMKAVVELLDFYLIQAVPDSTPEERKKVSITFLPELIDEIVDVNKIDEMTSKMSALKAKIAQVQAAKKAKDEEKSN